MTMNNNSSGAIGIITADNISIIDEAFDKSFRILKRLKVDLFDNQVDIIEHVIDINCEYIIIVCARGSGKTYAVAAGLILLCEDNADYKVGIFAPKADQATRVVGVMYNIIAKSNMKDSVDFKRSTKTKIYFKNGSFVIAQSASEQAENVGEHYNCLVVDESQKVRDHAMSETIIPMATGAHQKIIKIGVPRYRNHFFKSFKDSKYTKIAYDWTRCPILLQGGSITLKDLNGIEKEYPRKQLEYMPLSLKIKLFPHNPELHEQESEDEMDENDFKTQYMIEWIESLSLLLTDEDKAKLIGTHNYLNEGRPGEEYFFGIDFASGTLIVKKNKQGEVKQSGDFHALSVWRRLLDGTKEKVFGSTWSNKESPLDVLEECKAVVHPVTGRFRCKFGLLDFSVLGVAALDSLKKDKFPVEGVQFGATEHITHKNWKNALVDLSMFELRHDRVKYPNQDVINSVVVIKKGYSEWCNIEKEEKLGPNARLEAAEGFHDDIMFSDALCIWACDKHSTFKQSNVGSHTIIMPVMGGSTTRMPGGGGHSGQKTFGDRMLGR